MRNIYIFHPYIQKLTIKNRIMLPNIYPKETIKVAVCALIEIVSPKGSGLPGQFRVSGD